MERDAIDVLRGEYQLTVIESQLLREKGNRKVWFIHTSNGSFCFKKYDLELRDYHFCFALQNHLIKQNSNIPRIIPTHNAHQYACDQNGRVYALFEWISGAQPIDLHKQKGLKKSMTAIARFHSDAKGFSPVDVISQKKKRYRINTTKERKEFDTLKSWDASILGKKGVSYHRGILEEATKVIENMDTLILNGDLEEEALKGYIAHNDFADINLLATKGHTYVIDLDTAAYNYPTVDLLNIYIKTSHTRLIHPTILPLWLQTYESVFPLSPTLKRYFIYQLQLPTMYYRLLNKYVVNKGGLSRYLELYNWENEKNKVLLSLL